MPSAARTTTATPARTAAARTTAQAPATTGSLAVAQVNARQANGKMAAAVARRIVADITAAGWPEGEVVGAEAALLERYGVSRAVFREAVRLLEHQGVARMRRGPGGGLVVTQPSVDAVTDAVMVYLVYIAADLDEVSEVRRGLEGSAASLAAERVDEGTRATLHDLLEREARGDVTSHREMHSVVAQCTANPAIEFFVELLNRVVLLFSPAMSSITGTVRTTSASAHSKIVESILAGDAGRAASRMRTHLDAEAAFMTARLPRKPQLAAVFSSGTGNTKLAESVARQLFEEVTDAGWVVGQPLGDEHTLMARFDVSRAVLREAVRLLEHHGIARTRRGPGGGLFVTEPGLEATTEAVALCLDRRGIVPGDLVELRTILDELVPDPASSNPASSNPVSSNPVSGNPVSGNRVLQLLANVLVLLRRDVQ